LEEEEEGSEPFEIVVVEQDEEEVQAASRDFRAL
jgi:hypothetical protein